MGNSNSYTNVHHRDIIKDIADIKNWCVNHIAPRSIRLDKSKVDMKEAAKIKCILAKRPVDMTCEQTIEYNYWKNMFKYIYTYQIHRDELHHMQPGCLDSDDILLFHYTGMGAMSTPSVARNLFQAGVLFMSVLSALLQIIKANDTGGISVYSQLAYIIACILSVLYIYNVSKMFALLQLGCLATAILTIYGVTTSEETKDTAWSHFP